MLSNMAPGLFKARDQSHDHAALGGNHTYPEPTQYTVPNSPTQSCPSNFRAKAPSARSDTKPESEW